ncbi:MAG TPA: LacI family DNA-binding transcriptional regulator [Opitutaceae bacterium]|nr:LacI family DNA-binding transcriptional regulator [Opitutaceae bacterium]
MKKKSSARAITSTAEFARYVGLARTTVSRVLNGQPGLKPNTIERVQRAMDETGFTPNAYAVRLKGKSTATIGICMEDLLTPTAVKKLAALQRVFRGRQYTSLIEVLEPGHSRRLIRHFLSMRVEAIVFIGHFPPDELVQRIAELNAHGTPHVVIDHVGIPNAHRVTLDRARGMIDVVDHLVARGHRSFGLLGISAWLHGKLGRMHGIIQALAKHKLPFAQCTRSLDHLHVRENDFEFGRTLAASFATLKDRPTAYLALNDEIAIGAMHGLQAAGIDIPGEAAVTGFNNQEICAMTRPTLTSVDQQIEETIRIGTEVVLSQIGQPPRVKPILRTIEPKLIIRQSTDARPG